jgi:hypothetical protein
MLCTAIFMRKYEKINGKIAALSPCIAKSNEFDATNAVDYNVTIKKLLQYIDDNNVMLPMEQSGFDNYESGLGALFPMPGGLKENIEYYIGKTIRIDKSEGPHAVYKALDEYSRVPNSKKPVLFDVLNCAEGCNLGTGCRHNQNIFNINSIMDDMRQSSIQENRKHYLDELYQKFDDTLRLEDFIRNYQVVSVRPIPVSDGTLEKAFHSLGKFDDAAKHFDCGACGHDRCYDMALQIAKGINTPLNCLDKAHQDAKREHAAVMNDLSGFADILKDTADIKSLIENIVTNVVDITDAIVSYNRMISDIEKIALQVNIISLNASIEAARAGEHGRAFSVVAEEIRRLAKTSDESAQKTKDASVKATGAVEAVNEMISTINERINSSYNNIYTLSEKTKEILFDPEG